MGNRCAYKMVPVGLLIGRYTMMTFVLVHTPRRERVATMICVTTRTVGLWVWGGIVADSCPWEISAALSL